MDISVHKTSFKLQFVPSIGIVSDAMKREEKVSGDVIELEQPFTKTELIRFAVNVNKQPINFNYEEKWYDWGDAYNSNPNA